MLGISLVTNLAAGISPEPLSHEEVLEAGREAAPRLRRLLAGNRGRAVTSSAPALSGDLARAIASWTEQDPDPQTRQQLDDLLTAANAGDARAMAELADAFSGRLEFGTAGLRGALGPGPNRMNRVVVGQAAAGLASYLA